MIVDAHCHLVDRDWLPQRWWDGVVKVAIHVLEKMGMPNVTADMVMNELLPAMMFDPSGERQLAAMEDAGIDMVVLFPVDYGLPLGEPPVSIEDINKAFADLAKKYPNKFVAVASVDPRRPQARDLVKQAVEELGMKGLKFHCGSGFYPNSKESYALLECIAQYNLPVISHTGHILAPLYSKYCDPMWLDDVCVDFPDTIFVAAHFGHGFHRQVAHFGACKTNLWTDFSDWQRRAAHEYKLFCESVRSALDNFTPERVMFGTDGPYLRQVLTDKDYVQKFKDLPEKAADGISFTKEEIDAVLGGNAARLFNLT